MDTVTLMDRMNCHFLSVHKRLLRNYRDGNMKLSKCSEFISAFRFNSLLASLVALLIEFNYVEVSSLFL